MKMTQIAEEPLDENQKYIADNGQAGTTVSDINQK
jgi:hypothetical protein